MRGEALNKTKVIAYSRVNSAFIKGKRKGSCTENPARIPRVVDVYVAGSKASESLESNSKYESSEQIHLNWLNSQCQSKGKCFCSYKQRILDRFLLSAFVALG